MLYSKKSCLRPSATRLPALLLAALLCICQVSIAQAQPNNLISGDVGAQSSNADNGMIDPNTIAPSKPASPKVSPAEAAELVRSKVGGQVMSVNTQNNDTGVVYGVKVLNEGRMRVIHVDGQTGQILHH